MRPSPITTEIPLREEQIDDAVSSIVMVEENEQTPMHQPCPLLQLIKWGSKILKETNTHRGYLV
jgi:hypothetical protein